MDKLNSIKFSFLLESTDTNFYLPNWFLTGKEHKYYTDTNQVSGKPLVEAWDKGR